jgi:fluoroacetyl-CoA thioesterase
MKGSLAPGVTREASYAVTAEMAPPHLPVKVLSTPSMIQLIEGTCLQAAAEHLDDGETTVGTHVCVSHSGAASAGEEVTVSCRLETIERRRLTFVVEVRSPRGTISEGTHQRAVIDTSRFGGA